MRRFWIHITIKFLAAGGKMLSANGRSVLFVLMVLLSAGVTADAGEEKSAPTEYQVKAAYLYNFARFVEWPDNAFDGTQASLILGILGADPFGDAFDSVRGKTVKGRTFVVKNIHDIRDSKDCHILFVSASEKGHWQAIFKAIQHGHVLTAGDAEGFAKAGGVVNFVIMDKRVTFEVNVDAAARKRLSFNSRILNIATIVHDAVKTKGE